jgi:Ca2+:H+ antiporter
MHETNAVPSPNPSSGVPREEKGISISRSLRGEWALPINIATAALFLIFSKSWLSDLSNPAWFSFILLWLFVVILISAFAVVRHAEELAHILGEPLGTLILTLAVTGIEVAMIAAVMYASGGGSSMARDAMFAVVMIVLNGMVGISLILGGMRHREQTYNLQGANAFMAVIIPLSVLSLILPNYTLSTPGPSLSSLQSVFLIVMSIGLYGVFLAIQNMRHREYFLAPPSPADDHALHKPSGHSTAYHGIMLAVYLVPLVVLCKKLATPIDHGIRVLHAPAALGGFLVAVLILSPESLSAVRAAMGNQLQRSVNLLMGSVLATISLTVPAVLIIGFMNHQQIILGLSPSDTILLVLTLALTTLTFGSVKTNVLLGAVHLLMFLAYLMLIFER